MLFCTSIVSLLVENVNLHHIKDLSIFIWRWRARCGRLRVSVNWLYQQTQTAVMSLYSKKMQWLHMFAVLQVLRTT